MDKAKIRAVEVKKCQDDDCCGNSEVEILIGGVLIQLCACHFASLKEDINEYEI